MIIQEELKELKHSHFMSQLTLCVNHSDPTSSMKPLGSPWPPEQAVACSELPPCLYVSTALVYLDTCWPWVAGSWSCLGTLTVARQKEFLIAKKKRKMAWLRKGSRGWFVPSDSLLACTFTYWVLTTIISLGDGDCGVNCPAKEALPTLPLFPVLSSPATCITFPQFPGPRI